MFRGGYGNLELQGDHLDLSYRDPAAWPSLTPGGSIRSFTFDFGDPTAGPSVQLGLMTPVEGEALDWKHAIDPVHHHGSDQFRVISGGEWNLAGKPITAGGYAFQESGWVYQEHPGPGGAAWVALVMGDRRGTPSTLRFARDRDTLFAAGADYGEPPPGSPPYPHPAGPKGIAAIATTAGFCEKGYLLGTIADLAEDETAPTMTGLLGDATVGPVVHLLKSGSNDAAIPACTYPTELLLIVVRGSCRVGPTEYRGGDLRVQQADAAMEPLVGGPDGLEAVLIVADRRARPVPTANAAPPDWMFDADSVLRDLSPMPGGTWRARQPVPPERAGRTGNRGR
jgi:hypothetical protein